MGRIIIELKDPDKRDFLFELLAQLDFISVEQESEELPSPSLVEEEQAEYSLLDCIGMWKDRDINVNELRAKAWKIGN